MVGTLIVAAAAGTTAAGVAASFALTAAAFAVNFAVSMIVTRMFGDNPEKQQDMGVRQQVPPSSVNAIPVVYGDAYMGGTFVDAVLTTDQKTMYYVLAISSISSANSTLGTSAGVFNYDMSEMYYGDRLISFASSGTVQSARVFNGGTGYVVGDVLTISGGTFTTASTVTVASVTTGGVIATVTVTNAGSYTSAPNNPAITTGGAGTGATIALKFSTYTNTVTALSDEAGNVDTKINTNLYINLYKSTSAGVITSVNGASAPSVVMGGSDISAAQQWTGTRQMNNLAFAIVKLVYNRDADTTQLNPITFHVSHYPNGASVAKPGDVWLDYITNQEYGGAVGWMPDGSFSASFVDTTCVATLNTYSDQTITYTPVGGSTTTTQARYRINGVLDAGQTVLSNLDRIMSSCDSWMTYNAALGQWSVVVNKAETAAYAFNDNNIIGDIRVSATDITSSINQIEARFPFKSNRDQAAFVNLETPYALLYPNEPVNKYSITYDLVNDSVQAQYLANRLLEQAREDLIVSFSTTYYGIQVDAGTVVSVTNADYGWTDKLFRVMKVNEASLPDGSLGAKLELNEYNAQVYDDYSIQQFTPAPNSNLPSVSYFSPLSAPTVTGYPSATIPYINVQVFVPTTGRVTFGSLFWTTSATPTSADWKLVTTASTANNQPVTNGVYYTYSNITLNTGTYYFAYNVGNDVTTSTLSPISSALVWNPVAGAGPTGATGPTGTGGLNSASVYLYNKNTTTTPPTLFSGTFTYTFATGVLSGGTLNGWSQTPPSVAAGEYLFLSLATASSTTATDTIPYTEFSTPQVVSGTGTSGANTAIVSLFNKNTSAVTPPTTFSGTFTYTFSTAVLSGGTLNGWSQSAPTLATGEYLWQRQATAFSTASTDTIASTEFSSAVVTGAYGPTGPTGTSGPTGATGASITGATGPRNAQVYFYYSTGQSSAPVAPTTAEVAYNFSTQTASITTSGWSTTFNPSAVSTTSANNKYWAVLVVFQETTYGGAYSETISTVFTWQNLNGLVTFTNLANSVGSGGTTTTFIDGGAIIADSLSVNKVENNTSGTFNTYVTFGLGTGSGIGGYLGGGAFTSTDITYYGILAANTGTGYAIGAGSTNNNAATIGAIVAAGAGNTSFSTYKNGAFLGTGLSGGTFQTGGSSNLQSAVTADIRLAYYTGGTSYAYYITSGAAYPFTAGHDGLQLLTEPVPEIGDIMVDVALVASPNVNDSITQMTVSTSANQKGAIGVFTGVCGNEFVPASLGYYIEGEQGCINNFVMKPEYANIYDTYRPIGVNAIGEGKINVCGQNGDIAIGDFIVASDMAGKGMKQTDDTFQSYTIAKARQAVTFSNPSDVQMIACIYMGG